MRWVSAISSLPDPRDAVREAVDEAREHLAGATPDLLLAFVSSHFRGAYTEVPGWIAASLPARVFAGCSSLGQIGGGLEREQSPGISLVAAVLPGVDIELAAPSTAVIPDQDAPPEAWRSWWTWPQRDAFAALILADPFSAGLEAALEGLDYAYPGAVAIGGLASGAGTRAGNVMYSQDRITHEGMIGVALSGNIRMRTMVAQGCRPIGEPVTVTCCDDRLLLEVDGQTPVEYLRDLMRRLNTADRDLARSSLFLGAQMNPYQSFPGPGDFLVRNVVGIDDETGAMATAVSMHEGEVVQFHVRDRQSSIEDLDHHLAGAVEGFAGAPVSGALLFSCLGRGTHLFGETGHDSRRFLETFGPVPLGGFFSNGEIGPVGAQTYIHGYTSSFGLFRPLSP